jgi:hypothetical protein
MDLEVIFSLPKYHRRTFFLLVALITGLLLVINFLVFFYVRKDIAEPISLILAHLISAAIASGITVAFLLFFMPIGERSDSIVQLPPHRISSEFEILLQRSSRWNYRGNFGRYFRSKVLKTLSTRANIDVDVIILDPNDEVLCQQHANYRNEIRSVESSRVYDAKYVALQACVTIALCGWYAVNRKVSVDLFLSKTFDPVRVDACDEAMVITVEDRSRPALRLAHEHFMYEHFMLDMLYRKEQSKRIDVGRFPRTPTLADVTLDSIKQFFSELGMEAVCERVSADAILKEVRRDWNPYE